MSFLGKVVLVIGASSGIGAATAILFSKEGADVVMIGRNQSKLDDVAAECMKYREPLVLNADITKENEAALIVSETVKKFNKLDVLINNAAIVRQGNILDGNLLQAYDEVIRTNLRAMINLTVLATPHLVNTKGCIVNVSSVAGSSPTQLAALTAYCVSKAGLNHFTRCAALELAPHGVRVNSVSPGPVNTQILQNTGKENIVIDDLKDWTALKRLSDPEEIAELIMFISSDKARSISGSDYVIDNGYLLAN